LFKEPIKQTTKDRWRAVYEICHYDSQVAVTVIPEHVAAWTIDWDADPITSTIHLTSGHSFTVRGYLGNVLTRMCKESLGYECADVYAEPPADSYPQDVP
jgi:hypothetical protein